MEYILKVLCVDADVRVPAVDFLCTLRTAPASALFTMLNGPVAQRFRPRVICTSCVVCLSVFKLSGEMERSVELNAVAIIVCLRKPVRAMDVRLVTLGKQLLLLRCSLDIDWHLSMY